MKPDIFQIANRPSTCKNNFVISTQMKKYIILNGIVGMTINNSVLQDNYNYTYDFDDDIYSGMILSVCN